jgi:hypothetical protein
MVPDSSPRDYGGIGILLHRLYVGFALCQALARLLLGFGQVVVGASACLFTAFSGGCARAHLLGVALEALEG